MDETSSSPAGSSRPAVLLKALRDWAGTDGRVWAYILKTLCAAFLTLWLALRLELPQPGTAVITVFIVMQPQSGQVFAKGFYRIVGSLVGLSVMLVLIALFAQERVLFLLSASLWIGLCTAGAARYRDFRAYACMLAGYTATLIGLPAAIHPETAFMQAAWRILEIGLGILCASSVSALILPQSASAALRGALDARFGRFAAFVLDHLEGGKHDGFGKEKLHFAAQAVGLEALRSATLFEDPGMRQRGARLARLNNEFMSLTTHYHALRQSLERLRADGATEVLARLVPQFDLLREILRPYRDKSLQIEQAAQLSAVLSSLSIAVEKAAQQARNDLADEAALLDFDTATELLSSLLSALHTYAQTHASLDAHRHERESWKGEFATQSNGLAALVAGGRTALMVLVFGLFWIATAWPSGATFVLNAAAVAALVSASPDPARSASQMAVGTAIAAVLGFVVTFFVLPHVDGFPLLCVALAPVFALGAFLSVRPATAGYGAGILVFFCVGAIPANLTIYDPARMLNDYLALILSQSAAAAVTAIILPPHSPWLWRRLARDLRLRVVQLLDRRDAQSAAAFESGTRDILSQAWGLSAPRPDVQARLLGWTFVVLEIGHALIGLRDALASLPETPALSAEAPWRQALRGTGRSLMRLFLQPDSARREHVLAGIDETLALLGRTSTDAPSLDALDGVRRIRSYLHFMRSTLLDPQSPLYPPTLHPEGVRHAA